VIFLGVADDGSLLGLSLTVVSRLNQMISNVAVQHGHSPLTVLTANLEPEDRRLVADFCPSACYTYLYTVGRFTHKHIALCLAARALYGRSKRRDISYGTSVPFSSVFLSAESPARPCRALPDTRCRPAPGGPLGGPGSPGAS
jgi:hypothetical protein